jgi:hypothetical protein
MVFDPSGAHREERMAQKRTINVNGQELEVIEIGFEPTKEPWSEYELADGGHVRIKIVVHRILQVLDSDGSPARTPEGDPFLVIQSINQVVVQE